MKEQQGESRVRTLELGLERGQFRTARVKHRRGQGSVECVQESSSGSGLKDGLGTKVLVSLLNVFFLQHQYLSLILSPAPLYSLARVRLSYLTTLKMLVCHIPYQRLVLGLLFAALAFQVNPSLGCI